MNAVLTELGRKLAERWVTVLFLPGLLYTLMFVVAVVLGQHPWYTMGPLTNWIDAVTKDLDKRPATTVLVLISVLLAAAAAGFLARAVAGLVERTWTGRWVRPFHLLGNAFTRQRAHRWDNAQAAFARARDAQETEDRQYVLDDLAGRRNRIALERPGMPTRIADRMHATHNRVWNQYGLDLTSVWLRLWLTVDETTHETVRWARNSFDAATTFTAWGLLYTALAILCWPTIVIGAAVIVVGIHRGRRAATSLGEAVEAVVDLHHQDLARALGVLKADQNYTTMTGREITEQLRKGA